MGAGSRTTGALEAPLDRRGVRRDHRGHRGYSRSVRRRLPPTPDACPPLERLSLSTSTAGSAGPAVTKLAAEVSTGSRMGSSIHRRRRNFLPHIQMGILSRSFWTTTRSEGVLSAGDRPAPAGACPGPYAWASQLEAEPVTRRPFRSSSGLSSSAIRHAERYGDQPSAGWVQAPAPALGGLRRRTMPPKFLQGQPRQPAIDEDWSPRCCRTATS